MKYYVYKSSLAKDRIVLFYTIDSLLGSDFMAGYDDNVYEVTPKNIININPYSTICSEIEIIKKLSVDEIIKLCTFEVNLIELCKKHPTHILQIICNMKNITENRKRELLEMSKEHMELLSYLED